MKLRKIIGLTDFAVLVVAVFAFALPPREMLASPTIKGTEPDKLALALAEARVMAAPTDGLKIDELTRRMGELGMKDWAVEIGLDSIDRTKTRPDHWRSLLATSVAYIERLEAKDALAYAQRALKSCDAAGSTVCPAPERTRLDLYREHIAAGVGKGIDPKKDPKAFREAGEERIRTIRLGGSR
jgi:hypothetical protein